MRRTISSDRARTHQVLGKLQESNQDDAKNRRFPPNLLNKSKKKFTYVISKLYIEITIFFF